MKKLMNAVSTSIRSFAKEEEGAQVVEYALIIALVSIGLALALQGLAGPDGGITGFIGRVSDCLTGAACSATAAPAP